MNILIIDDEVKILRLLQFNLESEGHNVKVLSDPTEAVRQAEKDKPDVIIMDLMMPVVDGYRLTEMLRASAETSEIPIIIISAKAQHGQLLYAYKNFDINYYISKPFTIEQVNKGLELVF